MLPFELRAVEVALNGAVQVRRLRGPPRGAAPGARRGAPSCPRPARRRALPHAGAPSLAVSTKPNHEPYGCRPPGADLGDGGAGRGGGARAQQPGPAGAAPGPRPPAPAPPGPARALRRSERLRVMTEAPSPDVMRVAAQVCGGAGSLSELGSRSVHTLCTADCSVIGGTERATRVQCGPELSQWGVKATHLSPEDWQGAGADARRRGGAQITREELETVREVKASLTRLMARVERIRKVRGSGARPAVGGRQCVAEHCRVPCRAPTPVLRRVGSVPAGRRCNAGALRKRVA